MVGAMEYQAGEPDMDLSVVTFFFYFSQKYSMFCSAGQIACVSTHLVTDE